MERFCGGEKLWDTNLTWGDDRPYPGFTECFQNTVLVAIASGWMFLASIVYIPYLATRRSAYHLTNTWKHIAKMMLALVQIIIIITELTYGASELNRTGQTYLQAYFLGPFTEGVAMVLVMFLMEIERRRGILTSGVLFVYWVLANITYIIPFYQKLYKQDYDSVEEVLGFVLFNLYYAVSLTQLVLNCLVEKLPKPPGKAPCPEGRSSFLSRLTFQWIQLFVVTGFRKPLTEEDMFSLDPTTQTAHNLAIFELQWRKEAARIQYKKHQARLDCNVYIEDQVDMQGQSHRDANETTPLLGNVTINRLSHDSSHDPADDSKYSISLTKMLVKTFGWALLPSQIWKLVYDIITFILPFLLRYLIEFSDDFVQPTWKGYVYSAGFFLVMSLQAMLFHRALHEGLTLGLKVNAVLIAAVFKKSLRMNNRARTKSTAGEIVNFMSVDAQHIKILTGFLWGAWSCPLQITLSLVFLYFTVGYSMFAGLGVMVLLMPLNVWATQKAQSWQTQMMDKKDNRIKLMTEILNGIKILKLYAWEMAFADKVTEIRREELRLVLKQAAIYGFFMFIWTVAPFIISMATFGTYVYTSPDHRIDPQTAFVAVSLFNILRYGVNLAPMFVTECVKASVSLKRIGEFLNQDDLDPSTVAHEQSEYAVTIENGSFCWDPKQGPYLNNINMVIEKGSLVAVVGTVGAGKSSLVSAILGEMEKVDGHVNIDGTTGYVSQQAWIQNASVRDNILFGSKMEDRKYTEVIKACALQSDLEMLNAGDLTEIGEKGINLSGGQKQRVSVARAVYCGTDIYLLDDPLSAVDSHVGKHIFDNVIGKNGLLKDKTRILVTHGLHWLPQVDRIVVLKQGRISEVGSYDELLSHDGEFARFLRTYITEHVDADSDSDEEEDEFKATVLQRLVSIQSEDDGSDLGTIADKLVKRSRSHKDSETEKGEGHSVTKRQGSALSDQDGKTDNGRLIEDEEVEYGHVRLGVYLAYARAVGYVYTALIVGLYGVYQVFSVWGSVWLTQWTDDPDLQNMTVWPANSTERRHQNDYFFTIYGVLGLAQGLAVLSYAAIHAVRVMYAARVLHNTMLINVLRGPMSFFDTTPVGRIVNRFSQDIENIDTELPNNFMEVLFSFYSIISVFVVIAYSTPIFLVIIVPLGFLYFLCQRFYIPTSRQLKRLERKTQSPIFSSFSETLAGVNTIRAFRVQERFIKDSARQVDINQEYAFCNYVANRWLGFRLEMLGAVVVLGASLFAVLEKRNISGAIVGLSVSYALQITESLNWLVRMVSEFETNIVSVERIQQYSQNSTEAVIHTDVKPSEDWPGHGEVQLKSYSTRYRDGLPLVLKHVDLHVNPGQKVGIVGRTGAGKSSLTLSLFRLIEPASGRILIDGLDISQLGLYDLRGKLTILPQDPVLFSGSLRLNLDPLGCHGDSALWSCLELAHLKSHVEALPRQLEYEVGEGGQNLSMGQRQLICLARALLRKSKVLVLDEATASVDMHTDRLIQDTISEEFRDCTVLTIAHRLNTVMDYDRILVLSEGEVKEFDSPQSLLHDTSSMFYSMARAAGLVS